MSAIHKIVAESGVVSVNNQNYAVHNFSHRYVRLPMARSRLIVSVVNWWLIA
jgi:hypothetical protein